MDSSQSRHRHRGQGAAESHAFSFPPVQSLPAQVDRQPYAGHESPPDSIKGSRHARRNPVEGQPDLLPLGDTPEGPQELLEALLRFSQWEVLNAPRGSRRLGTPEAAPSSDLATPSSAAAVHPANAPCPSRPSLAWSCASGRAAASNRVSLPATRGPHLASRPAGSPAPADPAATARQGDAQASNQGLVGADAAAAAAVTSGAGIFAEWFDSPVTSLLGGRADWDGNAGLAEPLINFTPPPAPATVAGSSDVRVPSPALSPSGGGAGDEGLGGLEETVAMWLHSSSSDEHLNTLQEGAGHAHSTPHAALSHHHRQQHQQQQHGVGSPASRQGQPAGQWEPGKQALSKDAAEHRVGKASAREGPKDPVLKPANAGASGSQMDSGLGSSQLDAGGPAAESGEGGQGAAARKAGEAAGRDGRTGAGGVSTGGSDSLSQQESLLRQLQQQGRLKPLSKVGATEAGTGQALGPERRQWSHKEGRAQPDPAEGGSKAAAGAGPTPAAPSSGLAVSPPEGAGPSMSNFLHFAQMLRGVDVGTGRVSPAKSWAGSSGRTYWTKLPPQQPKQAPQPQQAQPPAQGLQQEVQPAAAAGHQQRGNELRQQQHQAPAAAPSESKEGQAQRPPKTGNPGADAATSSRQLMGVGLAHPRHANPAQPAGVVAQHQPNEGVPGGLGTALPSIRQLYPPLRELMPISGSLGAVQPGQNAALGQGTGDNGSVSMSTQMGQRRLQSLAQQQQQEQQPQQQQEQQHKSTRHGGGASRPAAAAMRNPAGGAEGAAPAGGAGGRTSGSIGGSSPLSSAGQQGSSHPVLGSAIGGARLESAAPPPSPGQDGKGRTGSSSISGVVDGGTPKARAAASLSDDPTPATPASAEPDAAPGPLGHAARPSGHAGVEGPEGKSARPSVQGPASGVDMAKRRGPAAGSERRKKLPAAGAVRAREDGSCEARDRQRSIARLSDLQQGAAGGVGSMDVAQSRRMRRQAEGEERNADDGDDGEEASDRAVASEGDLQTREGGLSEGAALDDGQEQEDEGNEQQDGGGGGGQREKQSRDAQGLPSGTDRRARAEIHNQSERRRRDRINDRMRALQELIPNANKTDKASMLDEAIEYLKFLQQQLKVMSMHTGIPIPSHLTPASSMTATSWQNTSLTSAGGQSSSNLGLPGSGNMGSGPLPMAPGGLPGHPLSLTPPGSSMQISNQLPGWTGQLPSRLRPGQLQGASGRGLPDAQGSGGLEGPGWPLPAGSLAPGQFLPVPAEHLDAPTAVCMRRGGSGEASLKHRSPSASAADLTVQMMRRTTGQLDSPHGSMSMGQQKQPGVGAALGDVDGMFGLPGRALPGEVAGYEGMATTSLVSPRPRSSSQQLSGRERPTQSNWSSGGRAGPTREHSVGTDNMLAGTSRARQAGAPAVGPAGTAWMGRVGHGGLASQRMSLASGGAGFSLPPGSSAGLAQAMQEGRMEQMQSHQLRAAYGPPDMAWGSAGSAELQHMGLSGSLSAQGGLGLRGEGLAPGSGEWIQDLDGSGRGGFVDVHGSLTSGGLSLPPGSLSASVLPAARGSRAYHLEGMEHELSDPMTARLPHARYMGLGQMGGNAPDAEQLWQLHEQRLAMQQQQQRQRQHALRQIRSTHSGAVAQQHSIDPSGAKWEEYSL